MTRYDLLDAGAHSSVRRDNERAAVVANSPALFVPNQQPETQGWLRPPATGTLRDARCRILATNLWLQVGDEQILGLEAGIVVV